MTPQTLITPPPSPNPPKKGARSNVNRAPAMARQVDRARRRRTHRRSLKPLIVIAVIASALSVTGFALASEAPTKVSDAVGAVSSAVGIGGKATEPAAPAVVPAVDESGATSSSQSGAKVPNATAVEELDEAGKSTEPSSDGEPTIVEADGTSEATLGLNDGRDNHGAIVSDVAKNSGLTGREHGQAVAAVASSKSNGKVRGHDKGTSNGKAKGAGNSKAKGAGNGKAKGHSKR